VAALGPPVYLGADGTGQEVHEVSVLDALPLVSGRGKEKAGRKRERGERERGRWGVERVTCGPRERNPTWSYCRIGVGAPDTLLSCMVRLGANVFYWTRDNVSSV
jgi:hypothetical protein